MKYGICAWVLPMRPEEVFVYAAGLGLDGVCLEVTEHEGRLNLSDGETRSSVMRAAEETGMTIPTLGLNYLCSISLCRRAEREKVRTLLDETLVIATEMGVQTIQVPSFYESGIKGGLEFRETGEHLLYLARRAGEAGLRVAWENALNEGENREMLDFVNRKNFALLFDTQNPVAFSGLDNTALAQALLPHICEIHLKDSLREPDAALSLGEGIMNFEPCARVLSDSIREGWVLLESEYRNFASYENCLNRDIELMKSLFT